MTPSKAQRRVFTFVDYDVNRRGVTDTARAHLMKDRVRSKNEAKSEWVSRNQSATLRWMYPKELDHEPNVATPAGKSSSSDESDEVPEPRMSHYAAVIDFGQDGATESPFVGQPRSHSPCSLTIANPKPKSKSELLDKSSDCRPSKGSRNRSPDDGSRLEMCVEGASSSPDAEPSRSNESSIHREILASKQSHESTESRSEFGLLLLEGLRIAKSPSPQEPLELIGGLKEIGIIPQVLQDSTVSESLNSPPLYHSLLRYFSVNAGSMLGLDVHPEVVQKYDPLSRLFLPFASSSQWCFETMILLFSANHHRRYELAPVPSLLDAENQYIASLQNLILAKTRERISALAARKDSSDEDVVAFLFLALAEYCTGNREIGLMHFQAWREYCEMRRALGIQPCGSHCKIVVWWCISVMCDDDVAVDGIMNPMTKVKIKADPGKLFRYFETISDRPYADFEHPSRPELMDRRVTC